MDSADKISSPFFSRSNLSLSDTGRSGDSVSYGCVLPKLPLFEGIIFDFCELCYILPCPHKRRMWSGAYSQEVCDFRCPVFR